MSNEWMTRYQELSHLFETPLSQFILALETQRLVPYLKNDLRGEYGLFMGHISALSLIQEWKIKETLILLPVLPSFIQRPSCPHHFICGSYADLPFIENSLDVIILPHTLEWSDHVKLILREVERTLKPGGYLVILGFNPWSLCGLRHLITAKQKMPWGGSFYSVGHIRRALQEINLKIMTTERFFQYPPINACVSLKKSLWINKITQFILPIFEGIYLIIAQKRVLTVTPLRVHWEKMPSWAQEGSMIEPIRKQCSKD